MQPLINRVEALLFAVGRPLSVGELAVILGVPEAEVDQALIQLAEQLQGRGISVARYGSSAELVTDPAHAAIIEPVLAKEQERPLSPPALETLAIVLYRHPVTKIEIEEIRGVASDQILANLLARGFIEEHGATKTPGRPMAYRPSPTALRQLGITDINELPTLERPE